MNDDQLLRYSRQIMLPQMDVGGQEKLLAAKVLIIGLGGLGCPAAMYLASAGVGQLTLADDDLVDLTNLQRQIAHNTSQLGKSKVSSVGETLQALNPGVAVIQLQQKLEGSSLNDQISQADVVVDATDNFSSRFEINRYCIQQKVPLVSGAAIRLEGQITVFDSRQAHSPCYQCLYEEGVDVELSCSETGVMAPVVGIIGTMQAMEVIKLITGIGNVLIGRLAILDAQNMSFTEMKLLKNNNCPACN
jgi:molybdopterin-synthase adenylyltransferase